MNEKINPIYNPQKIAFIFLKTPFFTGTAGSTDAIVDLSVQRDKVTGLPIYPSSGFKGVLRTFVKEAELISETEISEVFGDDKEVGKIIPLDVKLLAFPVREETTSFIYITSPMILADLQALLSNFVSGINADNSNRLQHLMDSISKVLDKTEKLDDNKALVASENYERIILQEGKYELDAEYDPELKNMASSLSELIFGSNNPTYIYYKKKLANDLAVCNDNLYRDIVDSGMEITARIKLKEDSKTSENLFYQEFIPRYTIFYTLIYINERKSNKVKEKILKLLANLENGGKGVELFFGGDETIGKGLGKLILIG